MILTSFSLQNGWLSQKESGRGHIMSLHGSIKFTIEIEYNLTVIQQKFYNIADW